MRLLRTKTVYLTALEVYGRDEILVGAELKRTCEKFNLKPLWAGDDRDTLNSLMIFVATREAIRSSAAVIAEISPFRGPHMSPGIAFQIGLAYEAGVPCFAYTASVLRPGRNNFLTAPRPRELCSRIWAGDQVAEDGHWRDEGGDAVENYGHAEDLFVARAVRSISVSAEDAIRSCAEYLEQQDRSRDEAIARRARQLGEASLRTKRSSTGEPRGDALSGRTARYSS